MVVNAGAIEAVVPLIAGPSTADEAKSRDASTPRSDTRCYPLPAQHHPCSSLHQHGRPKGCMQAPCT